jgi:hypothetical protein
MFSALCVFGALTLFSMLSILSPTCNLFPREKTTMVIASAAKPLPGPKHFYGLRNIVDMGQKGLLDAVGAYWEEHGDIFEVQLGPKKLVVVIHPEHVRHVTLTHASNYEKLQSYDQVRKYIIGDGIVTSIGDLWNRQRRLMAPFYTPKGIQAFADIMLRDTLDMLARWERLASDSPHVEMFDEMAMVTASIVLKAIFSTESEDDILAIKDSVETMIGFTNGAQVNPFRLPDWVPTSRNRAYWEARELVHNITHIATLRFGTIRLRFCLIATLPNKQKLVIPRRFIHLGQGIASALAITFRFWKPIFFWLFWVVVLTLDFLLTTKLIL